MKYLVGETTGGTAVFAVMGAEAVSLTALDAAVGQDLTALIADLRWQPQSRPRLTAPRESRLPPSRQPCRWQGPARSFASD